MEVERGGAGQLNTDTGTQPQLSSVSLPASQIAPDSKIAVNSEAAISGTQSGKCSGCGEQSATVYKLACKHSYCAACIRASAFTESLAESSVPNRKCCKCFDSPLPAGLIRRLCPKEERQEAKARSVPACITCSSNAESKQLRTLACQHTFCRCCLRTHLTTLIAKQKITSADLSCPRCHRPIEKEVLEKVLDSKDWDQCRENLFVCPEEQKTGRFKMCPGCKVVQAITPADEEFVCVPCKICICPLCNSSPPHIGKTCIEHQEALAETSFRDYCKRNNARRCPYCKNIMMIISGCKFVTCRSPACKPQGKSHFCIDCGKALKVSHEAHTCVPNWTFD